MKIAMILALLLLVILPASAEVIDDFEDVSDWAALPSDGVELRISTDTGRAGRAMRLDYDFHGRGGYAIARKVVAIDLPANYQYSFLIRGQSPVNTLEFKLVDPTGENVWWMNRRAFTFPQEWTRLVTKKRHISFAWGPGGDVPMRKVAAIEIVITAATGGKGTVWIDELTFEPREPERTYSGTPVVEKNRANVVIDSGKTREFGGLTLNWSEAADYDVQTSDDARQWETVYRVRAGDGGRDFVYLPESESRYVRLQLTRGRGTSLRSVSIEPLSFGSSRNSFFSSVAAASPRGSYPKYLGNVQSYWTVVGEPEAEMEWLVNEEGMVEIGPSAFSIEPFLRVDGKLNTWADVRVTQSLEDGYLPIPSVTWDAGLRVTVLPNAIRYTVTNRSGKRAAMELLLAVRPFQVNPPWQFLGIPGGTGEIRTLSWDGALRVNGAPVLTTVTRPDAFGATHFDGGDIIEFARRGILPARQSVDDPFGAASGALSYKMDLAPGEARDVILGRPFDAALAESRALWHGLLDRVKFSGPPAVDEMVRVLRSNLAYVLINADGAAIQPGSRAYDRSWIRDGSLTSFAMLRLGNNEAVRRYIDWYAPFQFDDGKIPCCVDARGADPVNEHDSHGQFIWLIAEYYRFTGDRKMLDSMWPRVQKTVEYIRTLRAQRMTKQYENTAFWGLVPESISHEGYSARAMHSYWDDFFILRGLQDAAFIAEIVSPTDAPALVLLRDDFRRDLLRSINQATSEKKIDFIPGSVELGDFDATSTTIAVTPADELRNLPRSLLLNTFERYWRNSLDRIEGKPWDAYTPYELRTVGTFLRLGQSDRAHAMLDFFFKDIRPRPWNHWAEVVYREPQTPKFIGDMPHTWVGSDYIRSMLDIFAYDHDQTLVIGAGLKPEWLDHGVAVEGLRTPHGTISYAMKRDGDAIRVAITGDVRVPITVSVGKGASVTTLPAKIRIPPQ